MRLKNAVLFILLMVDTSDATCDVDKLRNRVASFGATVDGSCVAGTDIAIGGSCAIIKTGHICSEIPCHNDGWRYIGEVCYTTGCKIGNMDKTNIIAQAANNIETSTLCEYDGTVVGEGTTCRFASAMGMVTRMLCEPTTCTSGAWHIPQPRCGWENKLCNIATLRSTPAGAVLKPANQDREYYKDAEVLILSRDNTDCTPISCTGVSSGGRYADWSGPADCGMPVNPCDTTAITIDAAWVGKISSVACPAAGSVPDGTVCAYVVDGGVGMHCTETICVNSVWSDSVQCGCDIEKAHSGISPEPAINTADVWEDTVAVDSRPYGFSQQGGSCTGGVCTPLGWREDIVCQQSGCSTFHMNDMSYTSVGTQSSVTCAENSLVPDGTRCYMAPRSKTKLGFAAADIVQCDAVTCMGVGFQPTVPLCLVFADSCKYDLLNVPAGIDYTDALLGCVAGGLSAKDEWCSHTTTGGACHSAQCTGSNAWLPDTIECFANGCYVGDVIDSALQQGAGATVNTALSSANCKSGHAMQSGDKCEFVPMMADPQTLCSTVTCESGTLSGTPVVCKKGCSYDDAVAQHPLPAGHTSAGQDCDAGGIIPKDARCEVLDAGGAPVYELRCTDTGPTTAFVWEKVAICEEATLDLSVTMGATAACFTAGHVFQGTQCDYTLANHVCTTVTCGAGGWDVTKVSCTLQCDTTAAGLGAAQTFYTCTGFVDEGTKCTVTQGADPCTGEVICTGVSMAPTWDASTLVCKECKYDDLTLNGAVATDAMKCAPGKTVAEADVCQFTISGGAQMCRDVTCTNFAWDVTTVDCNVDECTTAGMACVMCTDPSQLLPDDWVCSCPNGITVTAAVPDCSQCSYDSLSVPAGAAPSDPNCAAGKLLTDTATCPFAKAGAVCTTATCTSGTWDTTMPTCADTDECVANSPTCGALATCNDPTPMVAPAGDWVCTCANGFAATAAAPTAAECAKCSFDAVVVPAGSMPSDVKCDTGKYIDTADTCEFTKANEICSPVTCTSGAWDTTMPTCEPNPDECVANSPTCGALATCNDPTPMVAPAGDWVCTCTANGFAVTAAAPTAADCSQCDYSTLLRAPGATPKDTAKCDTGKMITNRDSCEFEKVGEQCDTAFCNNGAWTQNLKCTSLDECLGAGAACPGTCKDDNLQSLNDWTCTCPNGVIAVASFPDCNQCQYDRLLFAPGASPQDTATCDTGKIVPNGGACAFKKDGAACTTATCAGGSWSSTVVCTDVNTAPSVTCTTGTLPCAVDVNEDSSALPATGTADVRHVATGVLTVSASTPAGIASETAQTVGAVCECGVGCTATVNTASGEVAVVVGPDVSGVKTVECTLTDDGTPQESSGKIAVAVVTILPVNDPPSGVVLTTQMKVASLETVATGLQANWVTGVQPGPATAVDETAQVVTATCGSNADVFATNPGLAFSATTADLSFGLKALTPAGSYVVTCALEDGAGASTALKPMTVQVLPVAMTFPSEDEKTNLKSEMVNTDEGSTLTFTLSGVDFIQTGGIPFAVKGPGLATPLVFGGTVPLITITTDRSADDAKAGLLATAGSADTRDTTDGSTFVSASVAADGKTLTLKFQSEAFLLVSPDNENLTVALSPDIFAVSNGADICSAGMCTLQTTLRASTPTFPQQEAVQTTIEAGTGMMIATTALSSAPTTTGSKSGILALTTRAMLCPGDGPDKLDRTLNPLGLTLGSSKYQEYNGAVLGSLIINFTLVLICCVFALYLHRSIRVERGRTFDILKEEEVGNEVDLRYVLLKARFGWLVMPLTFLYGGAGIGAMTALFYSSWAYKLLGSLLFIVFVAGFPFYVWRAVKGSKVNTVYAGFPDYATHPWWKKLLWGRDEWVPNDSVIGSNTWSALHHLSYDGYRLHWRYFLMLELMVIFVLSVLTAWQPENRGSCWTRALGMTVVLGLFTLILLIGRPYIAPYENVAETLIALTETVMMVLTLVAMGSDNPSAHWAADVASTLSLVAMWMIIVKFIVDAGVFTRDEYDSWIEYGGKGGIWNFVTFWFCFRGALSHRDDGYCDLKPSGEPKETHNDTNNNTNNNVELSSVGSTDLSSADTAYLGHPRAVEHVVSPDARSGGGSLVGLEGLLVQPPSPLMSATVGGRGSQLAPHTPRKPLGSSFSNLSVSESLDIPPPKRKGVRRSSVVNV